MIDQNKQYGQGEAEGLGIFNVTNGDIKNVNGRAARVSVNNNGTRSLTDLGDYGTYNAQQDAKNAAAQKDAEFKTMVGQDKSDISDFLTKYQNDTTNAVNNTSAKYDLPGQVSTVNALNTRIKTLQGNLDNSGAGGYSNANQVDSAVNSRYMPLMETAASNLNTSTGLAQTEIGNTLQPDVTGADLLKSRIATEMTGFGSNESAQLQTLLGILDSGVKLTTDQADNAEKLAEAKLSYQAALDKLNAPAARTIAVPPSDKVFQVGQVGSNGGLSGNGSLSLQGLLSYLGK